MAEATIHGIEVQVSANAAGASQELKKLADTLSRLRSAGGKLGLTKVNSEIKSLRSASAQTTSALSKLGAALKRIAMYRVLRSAIRAVTDAFKEGLANAYQFSKMNENAGGLANALDSISTASQTMKNQLGAAFGALLTALTPVIIQIIKLVTSLASAITRLIAIMGGSDTWLQAVDVWTEWGDAAETAGGQAKKALKYLAPFDELNVLPDQNSGGGGGGNNPNIGNMFQEVSTDVGSGLFDTLTDMFNGIEQWFANTDWKGLVDKVWQDLKEAFSDSGKATEVIEALFRALGAFTGATVQVTVEIGFRIADELFKGVKNQITDYNGDGKMSLKEFVDLIFFEKVLAEEWLKTWFEDHIVDPFMDGLADAFGFADTEQLIQAIVGIGVDFVNAFINNVINPIKSKWNEFADWLYEKTKGKVDWRVELTGEIQQVGMGSTAHESSSGSLHGGSNGTWYLDLEGEIKKLKDKIPTDEKEIKTTASVDNIKDNLTSDKRVIDGTIRYSKADKSKLKTDTDRTVTAGVIRYSYADKKHLKDNDRTITAGVIRYSKVDKTPLTDKDRTILEGKIRYTQAIKTNLTDAMKTIQTIAKFGSTNQDDVKNTNVDAIAMFKDYKVDSKLIEDSSKPKRITIDTLFNLSKQKNIPTIDVYTNPVNPPTGSGGGGPTFDLRSVSAQAALGISTNASSEAEEVLYRAMVRALNEAESGDITLDGDVLYRAVVNRNKAMKRAYGVNPMLTT